MKNLYTSILLDQNKTGGNQAFYPKHDTDDNVKEIMTSFLTQFYENKVVPSMIITNTEVQDLKLLENAFSQKEKRSFNKKS